MIRSGGVEVVVDQAALDALLNGPNGPVAKHLARVGAMVEGELKQNLSGRTLSNGTEVNVDTGRLRSSASHRLFRRGRQVGVAVGVSAFYGEFLSRGTRRGIVARPFIEDAARVVLGPSII